MASIAVGRSFGRVLVPRCVRATTLESQLRSVASRPASRPFSLSSRVWQKKYTEDHEWIELSSDKKSGTIGVSEYAAKALGDVVYVELPSASLKVEAGGAIGAVESVKSASDIMSPVSGTITESNELLEETPGLINKSPESEAWLAKIEVDDASELDALMDADAYKKFTEEADEAH